MSGIPLSHHLPLCLLRIWCRNRDSWISFITRHGDRYLVGAGGYYIELPNGQLSAVGPRVVFPTIDRFPSLILEDLQVQREFGPDARIITVPASGARTGKPHALNLELLADELKEISPFDCLLTPVERYIALRLWESGLVGRDDLEAAISARNDTQTLGQSLIEYGSCQWEPMLSACLDIRPASRLDPPSMKTIAQRKEWELTGEILISMGKLTRTRLEEALQLKREGSRALGEILTSMGACTEEDIERCLELQRESRQSSGSGIALIGQLLISRGILSFDSLEEAVRNQKVGRQSLEKILKSMGACTNRDIEDFTRANNWHSFQDEIDDIRLGHWLEKVGTISRQQLEEALRIQERGRQVLGEMLVSLRLCTDADIDQALRMQRERRGDYMTSIEKIGQILLKNRKVDQAQLREALELQSAGRQRIGCILTALNACVEEDLSFALAVQRTWREKSETLRDRLGDVLKADGVITQEELNRALYRHASEKMPLGRVLIEENICTPEQIITALVARDDERQSSFRAYLKTRMVQETEARAVRETRAYEKVPVPSGRAARSNEESFLSRLSSWIMKRK